MVVNLRLASEAWLRARPALQISIRSLGDLACHVQMGHIRSMGQPGALSVRRISILESLKFSPSSRREAAVCFVRRAPGAATVSSVKSAARISIRIPIGAAWTVRAVSRAQDLPVAFLASRTTSTGSGRAAYFAKQASFQRRTTRVADRALQGLLRSPGEVAGGLSTRIIVVI